ncbi:MAG: orotidine-5'-phosphate decarboxylase [Merismopedia sp. SIO2A8]|nr:orotidine-5'-phosphate decarboxylase [Symploca sp. SIO2B6]NET47392.1 orotidine-5'-phosphate decarboxylase [Merismopedia sp. SIO2A8]
MTHADRIIVPLDVSTEEAAIALLDQLPQVSFWKVGLELFVACGPSILKQLKQRNKKIFLDLKFHDISNTMVGACRSATRYGVDLLTVHGTAGREALRCAQEETRAEAIAHGYPVPKLLAITVLTSLTSRSLAFDLKVSVELAEYAMHLALLAQDAGIPGAVCSPQEASELRRVCGKDFILVCPGVRPTWAEKGDQRRSLTPSEALKAGADYLVIGRPITTAPDPAAAWEQICEEISMA